MSPSRLALLMGGSSLPTQVDKPLELRQSSAQHLILRHCASLRPVRDHGHVFLRQSNPYFSQGLPPPPPPLSSRSRVLSAPRAASRLSRGRAALLSLSFLCAPRARARSRSRRGGRLGGARRQCRRSRGSPDRGSCSGQVAPARGVALIVLCQGTPLGLVGRVIGLIPHRTLAYAIDELASLRLTEVNR